MSEREAAAGLQVCEMNPGRGRINGVEMVVGGIPNPMGHRK